MQGDAEFTEALRLVRTGQYDDAIAVCDQHSDQPRFQEQKAIALRRSGRAAASEAYLRTLLLGSDAAWMHAHLGLLLSHRGARREALEHLRRAYELAPKNLDYRFTLIDALERDRTQQEGDSLEEAYQLLKPVLCDTAKLSPAHLRVAFDTLSRVCAWDEVEALGSPAILGRAWAEAGLTSGLFSLIGRVGVSQGSPERTRPPGLTSADKP